jgi:hypothetical protein
MKAYKSIRDHNPTHLVKQFHAMIDDLSTSETKASLALDIVCAMHDVAVCDYCQNEWFEYGKSGHFVKGNSNGLLIMGKACCKFCLDRMYEESMDCDENEYEGVAQELGFWLGMFAHRLPDRILNKNGFWGDDIVRKYYKQFRSQ